MGFIEIVFLILVLVFSAIIHEFSHGFMADKLGDPTARYAGRLTLNPKAHIDPVGSILLPVLLLAVQSPFLFAYAKPVPFNTYNLKDQKRGPALIAAAGPMSNFVLAAVFGVIFQLMSASTMAPFLLTIVQVNVILAVFNLVPIPPLDGSKLLYAIMPDSMQRYKVMLERLGPVLLIVFIVAFSHLLSPVITWFTRFFAGGLF